MSILKVSKISKSFGGLSVLDDVSFGLEEGTITSLFGENGSGKTTLFNIITGFLRPASGELLFKEKNLEKMSAGDIARAGIGRVWQAPRICKNLSVEDNLLLASDRHPGERIRNYIWRPGAISLAEKKLKQQVKAIMEQVGLDEKLEKTGGSLSLGKQKLLSIGMLLMKDSEILLLDEPFAGVSLPMIDRISSVLAGLKAAGKTICLIEHHRSQAAAISEQIIYMIKGKIIKEKDHA